MKFTKPALSINQKMQLLIQRGLIVDDQEKLKKYLTEIGYFRLTGYCKYYQDPKTDIFYVGTTFEQVLDLYIFDRKLRLLMLNVIEKIEVSVKANIGDYMSEKYGIFWYADASLFNSTMKKNKSSTQSIFDEWLQLVTNKKQHSQSIFVKAYNTKYQESYIPSWMLLEELTLGEAGTLYKILDNNCAKDIGIIYNTYFQDLRLWLLLLVNIRNICAHHGRLWNRRYVTMLRTSDAIFKNTYQTEIIGSASEVVPNFFNTSLIVNHLLNTITPQHDFINKLSILFDEFPSVPKKSMGFEDDRKKNFV